jgi:hypothetical protein
VDEARMPTFPVTLHRGERLRRSKSQCSSGHAISKVALT